MIERRADQRVRERRQAQPISIDDLRRASWLHGPYTGHEWIVSDTNDAATARTFDFGYRLASGLYLPESIRLYATVKENSFFLRDHRFSKIDTSLQHVSAMGMLCAIAHALSLLELDSFSHLQPGHVETLVSSISYGADAVLRASERVASEIARIEADPSAQTARYRGFPVARSALNHSKNQIEGSGMMRLANLPDHAKQLPGVSWHLAHAALRNGMRPVAKHDLTDEPPAPKKVTEQAAQRWLSAIALVYDTRHHAECDSFAFQPFPEGVMVVARRIGVPSKPTPVPPPHLALFLLRAAATWVAEYAPSILEAAQAQRGTKRQRDEAAARVTKIIHVNLMQRRKGVDVSVRSLVEMLITACWIIIAGFSARRYEETIDIDAVHITGSEDVGWWIHFYIPKTTNQREWIPVPTIVERAFRVLMQLSEPGRAEGLTGLFCWQMVGNDGSPELRHVNPRHHLNILAAMVGVPFHEVEGADIVWHWVPRRFRRFFAVVYYYRYDDPDIGVLSHFLRHFDLETTRGYLTRDPVIAKMWRQVERDFGQRLAASIADGTRKVAGAMGQRLKGIAELIRRKLKRRLTIVPAESVGEMLYDVMEKGGLVITPKSWVKCCCPRTRAAATKARYRAGQLIEEGIYGPAFENAGPTVCALCRWALKEPGKNGYETQARLALDSAVGSGTRAGTLFGDLEQSALVELKRIAPAVATGSADKPAREVLEP